MFKLIVVTAVVALSHSTLSLGESPYANPRGPIYLSGPPGGSFQSFSHASGLEFGQNFLPSWQNQYQYNLELQSRRQLDLGQNRYYGPVTSFQGGSIPAPYPSSGYYGSSIPSVPQERRRFFRGR